MSAFSPLEIDKLPRLLSRGVAKLKFLTAHAILVQVTVESSLGVLSLAKGEHYGVAFPMGYNASSTALFMTGLQVHLTEHHVLCFIVEKYGGGYDIYNVCACDFIPGV